MLDIKKYFFSVLAGLISMGSLLLIMFFSIWWLVLGIIAFWLVLLGFLYWRFYKETENFVGDFLLVIITQLGFVGLLVLVEWNFLRWLLLALCGLFTALLFFKINLTDSRLAFEQKPLRRMKVMLWVFDFYAIATILYAINIYFPDIYFWVLALLGGLFGGTIALLIWKMYFAVPARQLLLWSILSGLITLEFFWVISLWPLGYLVAGFLSSWLWFILQLFIRFHFTSQGVVWKKQLYFLLTNLILYFIILFFIVRWI